MMLYIASYGIIIHDITANLSFNPTLRHSGSAECRVCSLLNEIRARVHRRSRFAQLWPRSMRTIQTPECESIVVAIAAVSPREDRRKSGMDASVFTNT